MGWLAGTQAAQPWGTASRARTRQHAPHALLPLRPRVKPLSTLPCKADAAIQEGHTHRACPPLLPHAVHVLARKVGCQFIREAAPSGILRAGHLQQHSEELQRVCRLRLLRLRLRLLRGRMVLQGVYHQSAGVGSASRRRRRGALLGK